MVFTIGIGFLISKMGAFPPQCAKGVSILSLVSSLRYSSSVQNISLPALVFYSMVSAFTPENIKAFGPMAVAAVLYMSIGASLAWLVSELLYVPADFQWGILVVSFGLKRG